MYRTTVMVVAGIIIVGLILRYGKSSNSLLQDFNGVLQTLTLQGSGAAYHGT